MKKLIAMLLALVMVLGLAACSVEKAPEKTDAPAESNPAESTPSAENVEISLWTYPIGGWGNQATVDALISGFETPIPTATAPRAGTAPTGAAASTRRSAGPVCCSSCSDRTT